MTGHIMSRAASNKALITPSELNALIQSGAKIALLDASYALGASGLSPENVFQQLRIGNAQFFDIDAIADHATHLPHMLPSADEFADAVGKLGIGNDHHVIVYDQTGIAMAACRAWWMFRAFGHDNVSVLNGGLPAWQKAGLPFENGPPARPEPKIFTSRFRPGLVRSYDDMRKLIESGEATIFDARPAERFAGIAPEPRLGMRAGHMPGAKSLPAGTLINAQTGELMVGDNLSSYLAGLDLRHDSPIVTTCGSGVTACVTALALHENGYDNYSVYDGSWSEWGSQELNSPIVKGIE